MVMNPSQTKLRGDAPELQTTVPALRGLLSQMKNIQACIQVQWHTEKNLTCLRQLSVIFPGSPCKLRGCHDFGELRVMSYGPAVAVQSGGRGRDCFLSLRQSGTGICVTKGRGRRTQKTDRQSAGFHEATRACRQKL